MDSVYRKLQILRYLGEHGPANKYRIRKESGTGSQPTVLAAVDELESIGEIKSQRTITHARGGRVSKIYDLTLWGLADLTSWSTHPTNPTGEDDRDLLDHLAKKYRELMPDLFDQLWPALREVGANRYSALGGFCGELLRVHKQGKLDSEKKVTNFIRDTGIRYLLGVDPEFFEDKTLIPMEALRPLRGNTILRKATMKHLADAAIALREEARTYQEWANKYEKLAKWFTEADLG